MVGTDPGERPLLPVACTLGPDDGSTRLKEWRQIASGASTGRHQRPGRLTLTFRNDPPVATELARLVEAERICCSFLGWALTHVGDEWHLEITGSDAELQALPLAL